MCHLNLHRGPIGEVETGIEQNSMGAAHMGHPLNERLV